MVETFTSARATIGELAKQIKENEFAIFAQTIGRPPDEATREIFDNSTKELLRDPRIKIKFLKDEIRALPLVNLLRNSRSIAKDQKLSTTLLDHEALVECAKSIGIKMRKDRLVTAVSRLIERQEAE